MTTAIVREYTYLIDRAKREKNPALAQLLTESLAHHQEELATRPDTIIPQGWESVPDGRTQPLSTDYTRRTA